MSIPYSNVHLYLPHTPDGVPKGLFWLLCLPASGFKDGWKNKTKNRNKNNAIEHIHYITYNKKDSVLV